MYHSKKNRTNKNRTKRGKKCMRGGKYKSNTIKKHSKWTTAVEAATQNFKKTGSIDSARAILRKQALSNARKLFGSI